MRGAPAPATHPRFSTPRSEKPVGRPARLATGWPAQEGAFLINPFGLHFSEVTASNLVKIDIDGNKLDDNPYPVNLAGFVQHAVFHRNLPDAHCIMHTHTTAGMAVSSVEGGLRPLNFYACNFAGQIAYHDFEGVTVRSEEGERLVRGLHLVDDGDGAE